MAGLLLAWAATAQAQQDDAGTSGTGTIFHTAVVVGYGFWLGQPSALDDRRWGYGATIRYLGSGLPLGIGVTWMRNDLDIGGDYQADGQTFRNGLTLDRVGGDLYYRLPPNTRGNVPYILAGGGQITAEGDLAGGGSGELDGTFWEAGLGIINGGSSYTAFALELKYIATVDEEVGRDDGIIELSMSLGYNW